MSKILSTNKTENMVYALYKQGLSLRIIGRSFKKSHEWARKIIEEKIKGAKLIRLKNSKL